LSKLSHQESKDTKKQTKRQKLFYIVNLVIRDAPQIGRANTIIKYLDAKLDEVGRINRSKHSKSGGRRTDFTNSRLKTVPKLKA